MADLNTLAFSLWRAHTKALHAALHGKDSADAMPLTEELFDQQYGPIGKAWKASVRAVLLDLRSFVTSAESQGQIDGLLKEAEAVHAAVEEPPPMPLAPGGTEPPAPSPTAEGAQKNYKLPKGTQLT